MELKKRVVVITGAAQGIGAALAERFSLEGAQLVIGDVALEPLEAVANRTGAVAVQANVSTEDGVRAMVSCAHELYGRVDVFISNAGILRGHGMAPLEAGPFTSDQNWNDSWNVNVMAHVWAARHVLPEMVARQDGAFIHIASAAGLLTEMGSQSYSVTKHAAVGFSEWLALHYRSQGIRVVCVCPQGVRTPMVTDLLEGHEHLSQSFIEPSEVAEAALNGLLEDRFMVLPHPEVARYFQNKARGYDQWLVGMRKLKKKLWGP